MRVPNNLKSGDLGFNMTPMIDVVFLLIIFFLVTSHLAKQEAQKELPLPTVARGEDADDQAPRVVINVEEDGELSFAGRPVTNEELQNRLAEKVVEDGKDVQVRIRASRKTLYGNVDPILAACARAGIWNVKYAVYQKGDAR